LRWLVADLLRKQGLTVVNDDMTGRVHRDRKLLSGDSPLASHKLGLLAADALIEAVGTQAWTSPEVVGERAAREVHAH
jgi:molecular chaperone Hsp31 and glyoxalase 3